ncbi:MAG: diphosphomevalonate decarboxylase [Anaerolineaceae bacterium]
MENYASSNLANATAVAHPNIAFIKYWGNRDNRLRIPVNGSISMNLAGLKTETSVCFDKELPADRIEINSKTATPAAAGRVSGHLDIIRQMAGIQTHAYITSRNNFPMGSGIASSASAFAALSLAASTAAGLALNPKDLSRLARRGSGSACRSIPDGIAEWHAGTQDDDSYADQLVNEKYWDLVDCLAITSESHKPVGSSEGHILAVSSPLQQLRVTDAIRRINSCHQAIISRDFEAFSEIVEQDSNLMHSVMSTSQPNLRYWNVTTFAVLTATLELRRKGIEACYTVDAGPNVHVITLKSHIGTVERYLKHVIGVLRIVVAPIGPGARLLG